MESLLQQSRTMCPFLKRTAPATLRTLSKATRPSTGGGTMSNLQVLARRCPVMSKALAVQTARMSGAKRFTSCAAGVSSIKPLRAPIGKRSLHTTDNHPASLAEGNYEKNQQGMGYENMTVSFISNSLLSSAPWSLSSIHRRWPCRG